LGRADNDQGQACAELDERRLLQAITRAQREFIAGANVRECFERLLAIFLEITASEYGFIGEVHYKPDGIPFLRSHALTNIAWDEATLRYYNDHIDTGLEFHNLSTLFGSVLTTGESVISNDPRGDPRSGGLPKGHPSMRCFLGVPFKTGGRMVGMVGLANRPTGYDEALILYLEPLLATCASLLEANRIQRARNSAEKALRENREQLQAIVSSAADAIITIDSEGTIQSANAAAERLFDRGLEELLGHNVSILMPSPHREQHDRYIAEHMETGKRKIIGTTREVLGCRRDGSTFPLHLSISRVELPERTLFTGVLRDMSELKAAQEKLESSLALVQKHGEDLRAILGQLRLGSALLGVDGSVRFLSAHGRKMLDLPPESEGDGHWEHVIPLDNAARQRLRALMSAPADRREKISLQVETSIGGHRWMEIEVHDDPRDPARRILFMYDTTDIHDLRRLLDESATFYDLVGRTDVMQRVFQNVLDLAKMDVTVLIEGETGTGKELIARAIHSASHRRAMPFVAVNCAGLTDSLLSSQLFGHRRGAFTGAISDQPGIFETASGGTVFLDEIGDISSEVQRSLLRVLQEREITRLGEARARKVDLRIIAATHRDLKQEVDAGRFRMDLLYRIRVAPIQVPPLRERRGDIPLLAASFLRLASTRSGKQIDHIGQEAMATLMDHAWPGNVRELQNAIEFAVVHSRSNRLEARDLPPEIVVSARETAPSDDPIALERGRIRAALKATRGKRAAAARALGISRATLYRRLKELEIEAEESGSS